MLLKNCTAITLSPPSISKTDIRIGDGIILEKKPSLTSKRGEEVLNLNGKIIMPGLVCAHTHLYSSLARGMGTPKKQPKNFLEILQYIWWKLDRALDEESIYYSALAGSIDAALCGTTTLIDHHASPKMIHGSLDIIKEAMQNVGLRGVLCYEVTDRGGKKERDAGLMENERFILTAKNDSRFRGMVGAHASFTLGNESLQLCGEMAERNNTGVHIHVAEDKCDVVDAEENYQCGVLDRLDEFKILRNDSILAHCVHLQRPEIRCVQYARSWFAHNPRSNMNNNVGHAPVRWFGERTALGTDGFPADMFEEARTGFFRDRETVINSKGSGEKIPNVDFNAVLQGGQSLTSEIFGKQFGTMKTGSVADLVIMDYQSPTPLSKENIGGHFLFGMRSSMVQSVMVAGKWIVKDKTIVGVDVEREFEKAKKVAKKLWDKM